LNYLFQQQHSHLCIFPACICCNGHVINIPTISQPLIYNHFSSVYKVQRNYLNTPNFLWKAPPVEICGRGWRCSGWHISELNNELVLISWKLVRPTFLELMLGHDWWLLRALVSPFALFYYYEFDYWMFELVGSACSENNRSTLGYYSCAFVPWDITC
jgi:hypothetical protein